jgi:hypothetical protein
MTDDGRFRPSKKRVAIYVNDGQCTCWFQAPKDSPPNPKLQEAVAAGWRAFWEAYYGKRLTGTAGKEE